MAASLPCSPVGMETACPAKDVQQRCSLGSQAIQTRVASDAWRAMQHDSAVKDAYDAWHLMRTRKRVPTATGEDVEARLSVYLERGPRGFSTVKRYGQHVEVGQRSWRKWVRASTGKTTWRLNMSSKLLPRHELSATYDTCAVVGSAGSLLGQACGADIDQHDAVFRINSAPVPGYERYVGKRETFRIYNSFTPLLPLERVQRTGQLSQWGELSKSSPLIILGDAVNEQSAREFERLKTSLRSQRLTSKYQLRLLDHSRLNYYMALMGHPKRRLDYPSTGLTAILVASQLCNQVSLYGFSFHVGRRKHLGPQACLNRYHYFGDKIGWRNLRAAHNLTAEFTIVSAFTHMGLVCVRDQPGAALPRGFKHTPRVEL